MTEKLKSEDSAALPSQPPFTHENEHSRIHQDFDERDLSPEKNQGGSSVPSTPSPTPIGLLTQAILHIPKGYRCRLNFDYEEKRSVFRVYSEMSGVFAETEESEIADAICKVFNVLWGYEPGVPSTPSPTDKPEFWEAVDSLLEPWQKIWQGDRAKFANEYPAWMLDAAAEIFAHDLCDAWVWDEYLKAVAVIIARHAPKLGVPSTPVETKE